VVRDGFQPKIRIIFVVNNQQVKIKTFKELESMEVWFRVILVIPRSWVEGFVDPAVGGAVDSKCVEFANFRREVAGGYKGTASPAPDPAVLASLPLGDDIFERDGV